MTTRKARKQLAKMSQADLVNEVIRLQEAVEYWEGRFTVPVQELEDMKRELQHCADFIRPFLHIPEVIVS